MPNPNKEPRYSEPERNLSKENLPYVYHLQGVGEAVNMIDHIRSGNPEGSFGELKLIIAKYGLKPEEINITAEELESEKMNEKPLEWRPPKWQ